MNKKSIGLLCGLPLLCLLPLCAHAQLTVTENFNTATTQNSWYALNGACLTASTTNTTLSTVPSGTIPGCMTSTGTANSYYKNLSSTLVGGYTGTMPDSPGTSTATGQGALRLTNGSLTTGGNGNNETGAIVSTTAFPSNEGLQITFNTVTYGGNAYQQSSSYNKTGADGMSFFLADASAYTQSTGTNGGVAYYPLITGQYGGSLGYDCATGKGGGMPGAYIGLGIDEYGNFVNSSDNGYVNDPNSPGFSPNTVGLRGAGNVTAALFPGGSSGSIATGPITAAADVCKYGYFTTSATGSSGSVSTSNGISYTGTAPTVGTVNSSTPNSSFTTAVTSWISSVNKTNQTYINTTGTYPISRTISGSGSTAVPLRDYPVIALDAIPDSGQNLYPISGQEATSSTTNTSPLPNRQAAIPISYSLTLTKAGLLSLTYSYNGGIPKSVISNQSILGGGSSGVSNGGLPTNFIYGFSAGTGGGSNVHEITCFKAAQIADAAGSAAGNVPQNTKVQANNGDQIYLASYNPTFWTGSLTATPISANTNGTITIASQATWDASCVLTGVANNLPKAICPSTGLATPTTGQTSRPIATWNDVSQTGVTFEYGSLSGAEQKLLNAGDSSSNQLGSARIAYLQGVRTEEPLNVMRTRYSVLGDIINSSPVSVGIPQFDYAISWVDSLYSTDTATEGSTSYGNFVTAETNRLNVVYVGANDGMLHGFASGQNTGKNFDQSTNTGQEVIAYVPSLALDSIHSTTAALDYSGLTYAHNAYVDATPGMGDLYYNSGSGAAWHTWLVGGLGDGGNATGVLGSTTGTAAGEIYALDVTNPSYAATETMAAAAVIGDWTSSTITCTNYSANASAACGNYMGSQYGTPIIRRLHNGNWAAIFGNGLNSANGTAGIFIMEVAQATGAITFDYIDVGAQTDPTGNGTKNGIAYVTSADLDSDHITDYIYAGDALGNVWRFDLTGNLNTTWTSATPFKLFSASTASDLQPITTAVTVNSAIMGSNTYVMIDFGTGRQLPQTLTSAQTFNSGTQYLYGIWDWNMTNWNSKSAAKYYAIAPASAPSVTAAKLTTQTLSLQTLSSSTTVNSSGTTQGITDTNIAVCLPGITGCAGTPTTSYGWVAALPNTTKNGSGTITSYEQIVYSPTVNAGVFFVNSTIPEISDTLACTVTAASGYSYAIDAGTGGGSVAVFNTVAGFTGTNNPSNLNLVGLGLNGVGTPYFVSATGTVGSTTTNVITMISQTNTGTPIADQVNLPCNNNCNNGTAGAPGAQITWLEVR